MKKRLISAAVGLCLLAVVALFVDTAFLTVIIAVLGAIGVFEALNAFGLAGRGFVLFFDAAIFAASIALRIETGLVVALFVLVLFFFCVFDKRCRSAFSDFCAAQLTVVTAYLGFSAIASIRFMDAVAWDKRAALLLCLGTALFCDTFAFLFGNLFGKHKLCPEISPKKTVEGAIGGLVLTPGMICLMVFLFSKAEGSFFALVPNVTKYIFFAVVGLIAAALGMLGDLAFSCVKRHCGIKDYGNIMPGHGGVLDRFDSVIFSSVFVMFAIKIFTELFVK